MKLNKEFFNSLLLEAENSERKRAHYNLHKTFDEAVQRICIALKKGTYVRPHHHLQKNKWELIMVLQGALNLVIFDDTGVISEKLLLTPGSSISAMELPANLWHTVYPETDETVIIEIKEGPYTPTEESDFAQWAPRERTQNVTDFLAWIADAQPGEKYED